MYLGWHLQIKPPLVLKQVPPYWHGFDRHSLMSLSHWLPVYPSGQQQKKSPSVVLLNLSTEHVPPFWQGLAVKKNYILCIFQRWELKHLSFALRSRKAVKSKLTDAVSLFDCWSGAVLTLPALVTDFGPRLLVTRVVSFTVHRGDTEYRALVPVIVGLTLYPHGQSQPG